MSDDGTRKDRVHEGDASRSDVGEVRSGTEERDGTGEAREGGGLRRRDLVAALASVPVLGAFFAGWFGKKARDDARRRRILERVGISSSGSGAAADAGAPAIIDGAAGVAPSDRIRVGIIGFGGEGELLVRSMGFAHPEWVQDARRAARRDPRNKRLEEYMSQDDLAVDLTAVCDLFDVRTERGVAASTVETRPGAGPTREARRYRRYTDMLDSDDVDAVIVATPDHWHARIVVDAAAAGKHVYCEKCFTRTEEEVYPLVDAVKQSEIVFQLGHQNRQVESHHKAREVVESGALGPITLVETTTNRNTPWGAWVWEIHPEGSPETIDWEHFQEPAPNKVPFSLERFFRWRCWFDYGTGLAGDLLSHEYDAVNQILEIGIPRTAMASGGVYFYKDGRDVPDVFQVAYEYPDRDLTLVYSSTLANSRNRGKVFMAHDASMEVGAGLRVIADGGSTRYEELLEEEVIDPDELLLTYRPGHRGVDAVTTATEEYFARRGLLFTYRAGRRVSPHHLHIKEWLECIRHGGEPSCNIDRAFEEAITCHMATRSYLEGRRVEWDPIRRRIV